MTNTAKFYAGLFIVVAVVLIVIFALVFNNNNQNWPADESELEMIID